MCHHGSQHFVRINSFTLDDSAEKLLLLPCFTYEETDTEIKKRGEHRTRKWQAGELNLAFAPSLCSSPGPSAVQRPETAGPAARGTLSSRLMWYCVCLMSFLTRSEHY